MNKMNWKWTLGFAAALVGTTVLLDAVAWAGKPVKPTPPPPPIHYRIHYFTPPAGDMGGAPFTMNEYGVMVGGYDVNGVGSAYIYDPRINPDKATDLHALVQLPVGWVIRSARSINDFGAILLTIQLDAHRDSSDPEFVMSGVLVDPRVLDTTTGKWAATPISVPGTLDPVPVVCYGRDINNNGDLMGIFRGHFLDGTTSASIFTYNTGLYGTPTIPVDPLITIANTTTARLNNPRYGEPLRIAGLLGDSTRTVFRYMPEVAVLETFLELSGSSQTSVSQVYGINGPGAFCGLIRVPAQKPKLYVERPFCFNPDSLTTPKLTLIGTENDRGNGATDINDSGDVVLGNGDLFYKGTLLRLDDLVVSSDPDDVAYFRAVTWGSMNLTERSIDTDYPCIGLGNSDFGCLLVPEPVPK